MNIPEPKARKNTSGARVHAFRRPSASGIAQVRVGQGKLPQSHTRRLVRQLMDDLRIAVSESRPPEISPYYNRDLDSRQRSDMPGQNAAVYRGGGAKPPSSVVCPLEWIRTIKVKLRWLEIFNQKCEPPCGLPADAQAHAAVPCTKPRGYLLSGYRRSASTDAVTNGRNAVRSGKMFATAATPC
jgi:hypothetical protein